MRTIKQRKLAQIVATWSHDMTENTRANTVNGLFLARAAQGVKHAASNDFIWTWQEKFGVNQLRLDRLTDVAGGRRRHSP